jgi:ATP-binding cassette, subfamily B, bacterial
MRGTTLQQAQKGSFVGQVASVRIPVGVRIDRIIVMVPKLRMARAQFPFLLRALRLVWAAAPIWTLAWASLLIVQGLLPVATVYLTRTLVNQLVASIRSGGSWEQIQPTLILAAVMLGIMALIELLQSVTEWIRTAQSELVQDHISALIHAKSVSVDLAFYELPEYHDHLYRARDDASYRPLALLESLGGMTQNGLTLVAMGAVLIPYGVWLPLALLASTLPALWVLVRFDWRYHQWWQQTTPERRRAQYYDWMLVDNKAAAELRLFGLGRHFSSSYQSLREGLRSAHLRMIRKQTLARLSANMLALLIAGGAVAWMVWRALQGLISLGDLALFYQAFNRGQSLMRSLLSDMGKIYSNSLFLGNLFEFLALESQVVDPPQPQPAPETVRQAVRFEHVTFRYPGSERLALEDFSLDIPAGRVVAIVGANGAGKSTLLKLLCRLYDPQSGAIEIDGVDIREFAVEQLRSIMTVLLQSPIAYQVTAGQNIAFGDLSARPHPAEIELVAQAAGAHEMIMRLARGYDTQLGKWFADGAELSGGEWQRLALARAFLRQAPIMILDEPTSAIDSWSESDWFERFRTLAHGRTALIITHRFTIAMRADVIHVMDAGRVVESGSHDELLAQGGRYAQSWELQMRGSANPAAAVSQEALGI